MNIVEQRLFNLGWWLDGLRGPLISLLLALSVYLLNKAKNRIVKFPRWLQLRGQKRLHKTRHNQIAINREIARAQAYKTLFITSIPFGVVTVCAFQLTIIHEINTPITIIASSPIYILQFLWLFHSDFVNDLLKANDRFRRNQKR